MKNDVFTVDGDCLVTLQYGGDTLDSATKINSWLLDQKQSPEFNHFCYFIQGQNAGLVDGVTLTGQTSGAVIVVGRVITTNGAVGSSDALGILIYKITSGEIVSGENLRVAAATYAVSASIRRPRPIFEPRAIMLDVETNNIRFTLGGSTPTTSTGTPASYGTLLSAGASKYISGYVNISQFQMIHAIAASNAVVNVSLFY